jgi:hypothetical protein
MIVFGVDVLTHDSVNWNFVIKASGEKGMNKTVFILMFKRLYI